MLLNTYAYSDDLLGERVQEVLTVGESSFKVGLGGLHSIHRNKQAIVEFESDTENAIFHIDITAFSIELLIQLLQKGSEFHIIGSSQDYAKRLLAKLGEWRDLRLKWKASPEIELRRRSITYKVLLLSIVGNLNASGSLLYNPKLYYSITINGQLILLEVLKSLSSCSDILQANTDGAILRVPCANTGRLNTLLNEQERVLGLTFGSRTKVLRAWIMGSNGYALCAPGQVLVRGLNALQSSFNSSVHSNLLEFLLTTPRKERNFGMLLTRAKSYRKFWEFACAKRSASELPVVYMCTLAHRDDIVVLEKSGKGKFLCLVSKGSPLGRVEYFKYISTQYDFKRREIEYENTLLNSVPWRCVEAKRKYKQKYTADYPLESQESLRKFLELLEDRDSCARV
uniref:Putative DNA polymerase of type B n=1 Tax=Zygnema circumcarinatum TaxID=35869 RepID=A0A6N0GXK0_ZYGCR|nr:putative DNA polymerase of type B [Zygnema circumcarinatum]QKQ14709.1 putative DNA polymerase of type B [Zygnema circumcarinatum]WEL36352.1 putative DNA polymerase of type B [Zygnema circumcarinatum]